jgi:membrane associated rhomboid family serine protease
MFTLPIGDDNPTDSPGFVTWVLIALCVVTYVWQAGLAPDAAQTAVYALGVVPAVLFGSASLPHEAQWVPGWSSVLTSMFLHGGLMHLGGNMLYLWIFGNNVEDAMGHGRFVVFYVLCGIAAALTQSLVDPSSTVPMIGASGAIAGVLGGYLLLHPYAYVRVLFVILLFIRVISVPAAIVLGLWFVTQVASGAMTPSEGGGVAFWAHVGGFVAGVVLVPLFRRRGVPLLEPRRSPSFAVMPRGTGFRGSVPSVGRPRGDDDPGSRRGPWG